MTHTSTAARITQETSTKTHTGSTGINGTASRSTLGRLRTLIPQRDTITFGEALVVAERQAAALVRQLDPVGTGLDEHHLGQLPRVVIQRRALPVSGLSHWNGQHWVICLNIRDSLARQRFTLLHEFKHIVDHGHTTRLYRGDRRLTPAEQAELAADYFAGCALVSKAALKRAWGNGIQRPTALADWFGVSEHAIRVRLAQTGLDRAYDSEPSPRCARPVSTPRGQRQRFHTAAHPPRRNGRYA